jgi:hypothetical protein
MEDKRNLLLPSYMPQCSFSGVVMPGYPIILKKSKKIVLVFGEALLIFDD